MKKKEIPLYNKYIKIIVYFIFVSISLWFIFIRPELNIYRLKTKGVEVNGYIYKKSNVGSKGTVRCFYRFQVGIIEYEGFYDNKNLNEGDSIKVVFYRNNPKINWPKQFILDY
jgi:hypothetical protein